MAVHRITEESDTPFALNDRAPKWVICWIVLLIASDDMSAEIGSVAVKVCAEVKMTRLIACFSITPEREFFFGNPVILIDRVMHQYDLQRILSRRAVWVFTLT